VFIVLSFNAKIISTNYYAFSIVEKGDLIRSDRVINSVKRVVSRCENVDALSFVFPGKRWYLFSEVFDLKPTSCPFHAQSL